MNYSVRCILSFRVGFMSLEFKEGSELEPYIF